MSKRNLIKELIDTLWNVNLLLFCYVLLFRSRINRYIMECKCGVKPKEFKKFIELIDTLWNVNMTLKAI